MGVRKLMISFLLLVLVVLFGVGFILWGFPAACFSSTARQEPSTADWDCHSETKWKNDMDLNETELSEHPDMEVRGKWQQKVISEFCHRHGMDGLTGTLPNDKYMRHVLFRHVLFNVENMALFCFIPKVGCTNMKASIFAAGSYFSFSLAVDTYKDHRSRLEMELEKAIRTGTFQNSSLTDEKRRMMMYQFERYTMVRNPLERVVSAYRSKFIKPLLWHPPPSIVYFENMKHAALRKCEPELYEKWKKEKVANVNVTFSCYIMWLVKHGNDDHFMTLVDNCQPCRMHYHFYGNFKNFVNDGKQILSRFSNDISSFASESYYSKGKETRELLPAYYSQLTPNLMKTLFQHIKLDLEFYHTLYPKEKQMAKDLLGLDVS